MKKLIALCLLAAPIFAAGDGKMNDAERTFLIERLEETKKNLIASISGLSDAQWKFKPAPAVWSVQECAEHLILAEDFIFQGSQGVLKTPAVDRPQASNADVDKKLFAGVLDRSQKATAPEPITPAGKFATPADAISEFTKRRDHSIAYVKSTDDDLRVHVANGPAGPMDAYQFLVLLAAHTGRHTAQIKEVESNAGFPKSSKTSAQFLVIFALAHGSFDQLTPDQMAVLYKHAANMKQSLDSGRIKWGGRTNDPKGPRGIAVVEAASEQDVREFANNDPAVKAGLFRYTVEGFSEITR